MRKTLEGVEIHMAPKQPEDQLDEIELLAREVLGWSEERTVHFVALGRLMIGVRRCYCRQQAPEALRRRIVSVCLADKEHDT